MDKQEYGYVLQWAKKVRAINLLGSKCCSCGESSIAVLDFHHQTPPKLFSICNNLDRRWSELLPEIKKCILLCANCHKELHGNIVSKDTRCTVNKNVFLEYKKTLACGKCGYSKAKTALTLHHTKDKEFDPSQIKIRLATIQDLDTKLIVELNKCEIICENCHRKTHFNKAKYTKFESDISNRAGNHKEKQAKVNRDVIETLIQQGVSYNKIA